VYRACVGEEIIALKRVERALKQRQSVLRDSDGELSAFLSHLEDAYTAALSEHNGCPPRHVMPDGGQEEALKFYFINCNSGHIVADSDVMFDRLLDGRIHSYSQVSNMAVLFAVFLFLVLLGSSGHSLIDYYHPVLAESRFIYR
jgi:hypothetical protein